MRFEVLTTVKMMFFWVVMPCGLAGRYQRFGETVSLKRWYLATISNGVTAQKNSAVIKKNMVAV
jgi:hypothetical protein